MVSRGALYLLLSLGQICMTEFTFPLLSRISPGVSIIVSFFTVAPTNQLCAVPHSVMNLLTRGASLRFGFGTCSMVGFYGSTGDVLPLNATDCDKPLILRRGGCEMFVGMQYNMQPTPHTQKYLASIPLST
jgi:hypothetical protein